MSVFRDGRGRGVGVPVLKSFGQALMCRLGFARCSSRATRWRLEPREDSSLAMTALATCVARRIPQ